MIDWHVIADYFRRYVVSFGLPVGITVPVWFIVISSDSLHAFNDASPANLLPLLRLDLVRFRSIHVYLGLPISRRRLGNTFFLLGVCLPPGIMLVLIFLSHTLLGLIGLSFPPMSIQTMQIAFGWILFDYISTLLNQKVGAIRHLILWLGLIFMIGLIVLSEVSHMLGVLGPVMLIMLAIYAWWKSPLFLMPLDSPGRSSARSPQGALP